MSVAEFYIPRQLSDLEQKPDDGSSSSCYHVECVMDVREMSEPEQVSTLQAVFNEISSSRGSSKGNGPIAIFHSSKFDALYSYVKHGEFLSRESKILLCNELPQLLKKLCKQVVHILSKRESSITDTADRSPTMEIDNQFHAIARSALKMYCCLICNLILLIEDPSKSLEGASSSRVEGSSQHSLSQSNYRSRTKSRNFSSSSSSNASLVIDLSAKEVALTSLLELLSSDLSSIWDKNSYASVSHLQDTENSSNLNGFSTPLRNPPSSGSTPGKANYSQQPSQVDEAILHSIFAVVLKMMTKKHNLFEAPGGASRAGEITAVGQVMHMILVALNFHLVSSCDHKEDVEEQLAKLSTNGVTADEERPFGTEVSGLSQDLVDLNRQRKQTLVKTYLRQKSVSPDIRDEIISPLCELMIKYDFIGKYVAVLVQLIDRESIQKNVGSHVSPPNTDLESDGSSIFAKNLESSTDDSSVAPGQWHKRLVRGVIEVIAEYCGVVPKIEEDLSINPIEPQNESKTPSENTGDIGDTALASYSQDDIPLNVNGEHSTLDQGSQVEKDRPKAWKISFIACSNISIDANACKNLVVFFEYLNEHHITVIHDNFDLLKPLLSNGENYDIRKSMVSGLIEIILAHHSEVSRLKAQQAKGASEIHRTETESYKRACESYLELLNLLFARLMDVSSVVRTHCIKGFTGLWEKKVLPLPYQLKVLESVVQRVEDRNNHTRKAAFGLVGTAIANNSFTGKYLSLKRLEAKRAQIAREIEESEGLCTLEEDQGANGIASPLGIAEEGASPAFPRVSYSTLADFSTLQQEGSMVQDSVGDRAPLSKEAIAERKLKLNFYSMGVRFIENIHKSIEAAFSMLHSRVLADVLESIDLISKANELRVDTAMEESYRIFPLVYSDEPTVQEAIRGAFCNMLFAQFRKQNNIPLLYRNLACIRNLLQMLATCDEGIIAAVETICQQLGVNKPVVPVITDDILSTVWGIATGESNALQGSIRSSYTDNNGDSDRRYAMQLYSILALAYPRNVRDRIPEIIQDVLPQRSSDIVLCCYLFQSLERITLIKPFVPLPTTNPLMALIAQQIVRETNQVDAWMMMAERGIALIAALCDTPFEALGLIMQTMETRTDEEIPASIRGALFMHHNAEFTQSEMTENADVDMKKVQKTLAQFVFVLGHSVLKQYIHIDNWERSALSHVECGNDYIPLLRPGNPVNGTPRPQRESKRNAEPSDSMKKELGFESKEYKREEVREMAEGARDALMAAGSIALKYLPSITKWVGRFLQNPQESTCDTIGHIQAHEKTGLDEKVLADLSVRTAAVLTLQKFMIINESVCKHHIRLLFTILKQSPQWWVRTNCLVGIGDLLCAHPNIVQPYLHPSQGHITTLLHQSTEQRIRSTTVTICTHLALNDMLRIPEMTPYLLALIGDDDASISKMGMNFLHELHNKNKNFVYNLLPVVCMHLCRVYEEKEEKFVSCMRPILEKIEKDRQAESIVEKLCAKYPPFGASGTTTFDFVVARYLTFCLSELNYSSDKVVQKLCCDASFHHYKRWMKDEQVRRLFATIVTKARRSGHGNSASSESDASLAQSTSQRGAGSRSGNDRRGRAAVLDEWEARIAAFLQSDTENTEKATGDDADGAGEENSETVHEQKADEKVKSEPESVKNEEDKSDPQQPSRKRTNAYIDSESDD